MRRDRPHTRSRVPRLLAVIAIAVLALVAVRGPEWLRRVDHPLNHQTTIAQAAAEQGVDPYLVAAVINVESGFRETVVSPAGAVGLMQVLPSTAKAVAKRVGVSGKMNVAALSEPTANIRVGTAYLAELIARYGGNVDLALAAYNAGITNADRWAVKWKPGQGALSAAVDFPETAHYVDEVLSQTEAYRSLYPDAFARTGK